ncbi:MAG TPA: M56 family metallopeptidase, partial [Niastella sp.]
MLLYLIKLSISLSIVYLFYQLFLRRLTFYNWNRWYLLIYSLVCFVIPFINVFTIIVERPALRESAFINYIPAITQMTPPANAGTATGTSGINWLQVGVVVIVSGMLFMIVRLLLQYYSLYKMRSKAVLLYDENVKLYHINEPVMPFSFGRGIYVNQHQHSEDELKDIIRHEFIHVKQRHSVDILWSELLCILNWYNPFAWLLRHDIRQNLEFIADQQVLQTGLDRKQYQYLLLKVIGVNSFSIATNFNFSSLKRRIAMMNKTQSARVHLTRFLFLLPLLVVVLLAFRNTSQERRQLQREKELKTDTVPNAVKEASAWKDVESLNVINNRKVTIRLKNGKVEHYDMQITREREAFEAKYGSLPEPPAPPAPPPAPKASAHEEITERPELPEKP